MTPTTARDTPEEITMMVGAILTSDQGTFIKRIEDAAKLIESYIAAREAALLERIIADLMVDCAANIPARWEEGDLKDIEIVVRTAAARSE